MPVKIIWISGKRDDPYKAEEVIDKAEEHCKTHDVPFSLLVNIALRTYLNMPAIDFQKIKQEKKAWQESADERRRERQRKYARMRKERKERLKQKKAK